MMMHSQPLNSHWIYYWLETSLLACLVSDRPHTGETPRPPKKRTSQVRFALKAIKEVRLRKLFCIVGQPISGFLLALGSFIIKHIELLAMSVMVNGDRRH